MAIQLRRGDYADFDPSLLLDGELAVVLENDPDTDDGTGLYVGFGDDNVRRVAFADEAADVPIASSETAGIVKPDGTTINVNSSGTISVPSASTSRAGLMSSSDKSKLNGIATGATANTASSTAPLVDGTASAGSSTDYARADHVHPTDTSRASASDLTTHTSDTTAHVTQAERTAWDAKYDAEVATTDEIGLVKPDNETIAVSDDGTLSGIVVKHSDGSTAGPILSLSAKGWAEQDTSVDPPSPSPDYPQEIRVCKGRNLLDKSSIDNTNKYFDSSGNVQTGNGYAISDYIPVAAGSSYVTSGFGTTNGTYAVWYDSSKTKLSTSGEASYGFTLTAPTGAAYVRLTLRDVSTYPTPQLERGSVAHGYVPYGDYVGLDVYDGSTHVSTTPIPLPSRGWAAGLPDGTADVLTLDGAGKVTWERKTNEVVFDGSSDESFGYFNNTHYTTALESVIKKNINDNTLANALCSHFIPSSINNTLATDGLFSYNPVGTLYIKYLAASTTSDFKAWLAENPITVLYPLANPVTEEWGGRVEMPDVPENYSLSIPELDGMNVKYHLSLPTVLAGYEDRIAALEAAIAELATS